MIASVSGLYIALTAIMAIYFSLRVVKLRKGLKIGIGNEGNQELIIADRVHANLVENAPFALLLILVAEVNGLSAPFLHLFGSLWLFARLLHAIGLTQGKGGYHFGRFWGVLITWIIIVSLAVVNIGLFLGL
ncbi:MULTISPECIES: MAPEG family protein [unclassified Shewanella]|uniref:MAPEG family protein n=1 Tax=unclassified Shewanella TaxID=196818 RepID=UPI000C847DAD|nr:MULTISPECIES: MAPEG family protein [unclassified Shewanella]MDO6620079.1 MAPEG family protein [Shewanella sp. 6_MG-2023]MDO6679305.1 MAPEG family protein [Shewanella sp. 4_MG-2023]MDO6776771.1 MAPEG family protein [Shewanella sp. 3_MG-2023]PMG30981.1 glutathione S-transferase [Shewanella sp. 10N.286.52.C2]PMG50819.1 glutathione S-transferase [Shewanella sp. 10N.286.52.B9]